MQRIHGRAMNTGCAVGARPRGAHALHADDAAAVHFWKRHQAAVYGLEARAPVLITAQERHGTRATFTLRAALFAAGATRCTQPLEQRAMWVDIVYAHGLAIELEHRRCHAKRSIR